MDNKFLFIIYGMEHEFKIEWFFSFTGKVNAAKTDKH
jgi:hypothetical protein